MSTPIYDETRQLFDTAIKSAEIRATIEIRNKVLNVLTAIKRPTIEIKKLIGELENGNN